MRNGTSIRNIGSKADKNNASRKLNGIILRACFLTLIIVAVALSMMAMHLMTRIDGSKEKQQHQQSIGNNNKNNINAGQPYPNGLAGGRKFGAKIIAPSKSDNNLSSPSIKGNDNNNNNNINNAKHQQPYPNGPKNDAKYAKDRVYCMVPFVWNKDSYDVIMKTWGRRCNVINFLTDSVVVLGYLQGDVVNVDKGAAAAAGDAAAQSGYYKHHSEFPPGTFPDNVIFINMTRPWTGCKDNKSGKPKVCRHIWEKMWRSWIYVGENHLDEAEWFCKVDYDTFFFPENLQYYVHDYKGWDPIEEHHYFGGVLSHRLSRGMPELAAGAAACWSHKTMAGITGVYRDMPKGYGGSDRGRCEDRPQASEEISTAMCLKKGLNVTVEPMRDDELREYVMVDPYHNHLTWNRTEQGEWWYWAGKPKNVGQMDNCCAIHPMAVHKYKQKEQIEVLEEQFYGPSNNKELKKLNERTRRYADKVRKAMGRDQ
ncbi:hypothetical protein ACHAXR_006657 [Thalassiosira sp. AJA248-18]